MEKLNKRVEQGQTIDDLIVTHCKTHQCCMQDNKSELINKILDCKYADLTTGIEWVGECNNHDSDGVKLSHETLKSAGVFECCIICKGTGTITRDATIEEVVEWAKKKLDPYSLSKITINNGQLRVKDLCEHGRGLNDYCEPCGRINSN